MTKHRGDEMENFSHQMVPLKIKEPIKKGDCQTDSVRCCFKGLRNLARF